MQTFILLNLSYISIKGSQDIPEQYPRPITLHGACKTVRQDEKSEDAEGIRLLVGIMMY